MPTQRLASLDALRGLAIVWMTLYHFAFDLNQFGYLRQDFYGDSLWTIQRTLIVGLFLFCAGLGQAVAIHQNQIVRRFWKRWVQVAVCALLVTAGSYWMYPASFIYFGVLHGIAVMLVIVRFTAAWGRWLWLAGVIVVAIKFVAAGAYIPWADPALLNEKWLNWIGLISRKPITEDYVPLVPWLGVMWWGCAAGQWLLARRYSRLESLQLPGVAALAWLGRWSLSWYMLHQPVMIGLLMALALLK
jgi:uncharacterized membrane protein